MRPWRSVVVTALLATAVVLPAAPPAGAIDHDKGHPGFCTSAVGVTVVVDFQELGGPTIVRCNPQPTRGSGLDALKGAGFQIDGVQRWGEAFICRIENRPSAVETVPVDGNPGYRERCVDTPPAAAYWSYWHAGNGCSWRYSQWGVKNRDFIAGGFEGWSFSLNATADDNPEPRIAPVRPGTAGSKCVQPHEPAPTSNDPTARQPDRPGSGAAVDDGVPDDDPGPGGSAAGGADATSGGVGGTGEGPAGAQGDDTPDDAGASGEAGSNPAEEAGADDEAAFTGGEDAPDVRVLQREQSGASDLAPWVASAAVLVLAGATWWTARRRARADR